jgi:cytochrome c oxidase assembly protein subunit 15
VLLALTAQVALGIATLLSQVQIDLALAHQMLAMIVLAVAVEHAFYAGKSKGAVALSAVTLQPAPVPDRR